MEQTDSPPSPSPLPIPLPIPNASSTMSLLHKLLPNLSLPNEIGINNKTDTQNQNNTQNNTQNNNNTQNQTSNSYCVNCGNYGHFFKLCKEPVCSYGLLCFYKKKIMVKEIPNINNLFNRKTKKTNSLKHNKYNKYNTNNTTNNDINTTITNNYINSLSRIKILKRHETVSHTLKNMLGVVGGNSDDIEAVDSLGDIIDTNDENDTPEDTPPPTPQATPQDTQQKNVLKEVMIDKVLLVQRRNTIGMIEFIRGKYDATNFDYIIKLFNMMTFDEKRLLREYDSFDMIRTLIGLKRENNYKTEYESSKLKFNSLKKHNLGDQVNLLLDKSYTKWTSPEWGIPKGRRNIKEYDIECAIREFVEETGIKYKNINVYRNIKPIEELYNGINGIVYKHIYFIANIKDTPEANENVIHVEKGGYLNNEISNVKLFSLTESHKLIRPYYVSKLNAIKVGFDIMNSMNVFYE